MNDAPGQIHADRDGQVLTLRIDNPGRANALDEGMLGQLRSHLTGREAAGARVVVLTGTGERSFSSGAAIGAAGAVMAPADLAQMEEMLRAATNAIDEAPCPVVAALNGSAIGGALELAVTCDWRIAVEGARFAMPPSRLGLVYSPEGLRRFVGLIGAGRTSEMFLTARMVTAQEALAWGLVSEVCPPEALAERVRAKTDAISALAPLAVSGTRAIIRALARDDYSDVVSAIAARRRRTAYESADLLEGLAAFAERRPPRFTGN